MKKSFISIFLLFTFAVLGKTPKELILERTSTKMVAEGIEFKPFNDMKAEQIKPLQTRSFRNPNPSSSGDAVITVYSHEELWRRGQKLATYVNNGARVEFYKLNYLPPKVPNMINGKFCNTSQFNKAIIKPKNDLTFMKSWFKSFTGKDIELKDKYPKLTFSFKQKWVEMGQSDGQYDFLILSNDKRLFYMHAKIKVGDAKAQEDAIKYFVKQIRIGRPKAVTSSNQSSKVKPIGKMSSVYQETVNKVIQEVANSEGWWYAQTKNYILKSNLSSRSKTFAKKIQERVEIVRAVYEKFIPPISEIKAVSVITVPGTRKEYQAYIPKEISWSAGVWASARQELVVSTLEGRDKRTAEFQMMNTLHHEAFHQYIFYALEKTQTPAWFNEGHADLFAAVKVTGSKVKIIEDVYHLRTLDPYFKGKRLNIQQLVNSSYSQFYAQKEINYAFAWSVVYFIRKAAEQYKDKNYDKILGKLMTELVKTRDMTAANKKAFEGIDMAEFQKDFYEFWADKRARSKAERNYIIPK